MIKIEVTGNSIPEVADKLLAIGGSLRGTIVAHAESTADLARLSAHVAAMSAAIHPAPVTVVDDEPEAEAPPAEKPKRTRKPKDENPTESATSVAAEPADEPSADTSAPPATTEHPSDRDAAPSVDEVTAETLRTVERVGRDRVVAILSQFGVARASQVPEERRAEYIALLGDA